MISPLPADRELPASAISCIIYREAADGQQMNAMGILRGRRRFSRVRAFDSAITSCWPESMRRFREAAGGGRVAMTFLQRAKEAMMIFAAARRRLLRTALTGRAILDDDARQHRYCTPARAMRHAGHDELLPP